MPLHTQWFNKYLCCPKTWLYECRYTHSNLNGYTTKMTANMCWLLECRYTPNDLIFLHGLRSRDQNFQKQSGPIQILWKNNLLMQLVRDDWFELDHFWRCAAIMILLVAILCPQDNDELPHESTWRTWPSSPTMLSSFLMQCSIKWVRFLLKFQNMGIYPDRIKVKVNKKIYLLSEISKKEKNP